MTQVLLLDTNVWIHLISDNPAKRAKVKSDLAALRTKYPGAGMATSAICEAECSVGAMRLNTPEARDAAKVELDKLMSMSGLMIVEVSRPLLARAAQLRAEVLRRADAQPGAQPAGADGGRLKLPDAIVAASCLEFQPSAILVTENVRDFRFVENGVLKNVSGLVLETVG